MSRRAVQQQAQTPEELQVHMEDRDTVIKEIRQALRVKSDEAEQQKLRAELVESRAERISLESEEKCRKLQSEMEQFKLELESREKDYEVTLDAYKNDIQMLKGIFCHEFMVLGLSVLVGLPLIFIGHYIF